MIRLFPVSGVSDAELAQLQAGAMEAVQRVIAEQAMRATRKCTICIENTGNCT